MLIARTDAVSAVASTAGSAVKIPAHAEGTSATATPAHPVTAAARPAPVQAMERARAIGLTLPLPREGYRGLRFADAPWTAPPRG